MTQVHIIMISAGLVTSRIWDRTSSN